jgi:hypothetical protein
MSKFSPRKVGNVEEMIRAADVQDSKPPAKGVRFTLPMDEELTAAVDAARKKAGGMTRLAWIRQAIANELKRQED